tara:strand:+ start:350 stop:1387 length:1038 start_codon:yes stop_codon:yes gene_type:complete
MGRILKDHQKLIEKLSEISTILRISQQLNVPSKDLTIEIIEEIGDVQGKLDNIKRYYIDQLSSPQSNSQPEQPIIYQSPTYESPVEPTILPKKVSKVVESSLPEKPKEQKEQKDQDTLHLGEKFSLLNDELETKTDSNKKFFLKELEEVKKDSEKTKEEFNEKYHQLISEELEKLKSNIDIEEEIKSLKEYLGEKITYVLHELETKTDSNKKLITEELGEKITSLSRELETKINSNKKLFVGELEKVEKLKETTKNLKTNWVKLLDAQETYSEKYQRLLSDEFEKLKTDKGYQEFVAKSLSDEFEKLKTDGGYQEFISKEFGKLKEDLNNDLKDIVESVKNIKVF